MQTVPYAEYMCRFASIAACPWLGGARGYPKGVWLRTSALHACARYPTGWAVPRAGRHASEQDRSFLVEAFFLLYCVSEFTFTWALHIQHGYALSPKGGRHAGFVYIARGCHLPAVCHAYGSASSTAALLARRCLVCFLLLHPLRLCRTPAAGRARLLAS